MVSTISYYDIHKRIKPSYEDDNIGRKIELLESSSITEYGAKRIYEEIFSECEQNAFNANKYLRSLVRIINTESGSVYGDRLKNVMCAVKDFSTARNILSKIDDKSIREEAMEELETSCICESILSNHNRINKRFDVDKYSIEESFINGYIPIVEQVCRWIDTYEMPLYAKVDCSIYEASFIFQKNDIKYDKSVMLESIVDYYLISGNKGLNVEPIKRKIIENIMISDDDKKLVSYLWESNVDENQVKNAINAYKMQKDADEGFIKKAILSLYEKPVDDVVDGTPNILGWIRQLFVFGVIGLNVAVGLLVITIDALIRCHLERKDADKALSFYRKEKDTVEEKWIKEKDPDKKNEYKEYLKALDEAIAKYSMYAESKSYTEECILIESIYESINNGYPKYLHELKYEFNSILKDAEVAFKDAKMRCTPIINKKGFKEIDMLHQVELPEGNKKISSDIEDHISNFDRTHQNLEFCIYASEDDFEENELKNKMVESVKQMNLSNNDRLIFYYESTGSVSMIKAVYNNPLICEIDSVQKLEEASFGMFIKDVYKISELAKVCKPGIEKQFIECKDTDTAGLVIETLGYIQSDSSCIVEAMYDNIGGLFGPRDKYYSKCNKEYPLAVQIEAYKILNSVIQEDAMASLGMALQGLRAKVKDLSTKEKELCNQLDSAANGFAKSFKQSMSDDRREGIIKGSLIPSFSKCIKLGIALTGVAIITQPIFAIIALFGIMATSKKMNERERYMMLDEIEIELKVVEKEISNAENDNDMNRYRKLLTYQKRLKKESFKIRYKLSKKTRRNYLTKANERDDEER